MFVNDSNDSEIQLIASIFRSLGTPTLHTWRDIPALPGFGSIEFKQFEAMASWPMLLHGVREDIVELVSKLVVYNFDDRLSAASAQQYLLHMIS